MPPLPPASALRRRRHRRSRRRQRHVRALVRPAMCDANSEVSENECYGRQLRISIR